MIRGLTNYVAGNTELVGGSDRRPYQEYFEKSLYDLCWDLNDRTIYPDSGRSVGQGFEMNRPSTLNARTRKQSGVVSGVRVAGRCKMVSEGYIDV